VGAIFTQIPINGYGLKRRNKVAEKLKGLFEGVIKKFRKIEYIKEYSLVTEMKEDFSQEDKEKAGWVSPAYTKSRMVKLDMNTLADNRCVAIFPYARETEVYKVLRTQVLRYTKEKGGNTIMITSALPEEGKTLTAINLSFTFAKLFEQTVLLVDGDLRQQDIHKRLGFESDRGLADYLVDNRPVPEIITWPGIDKLTLISGGRLIHESTELLGSTRMTDLVQDMKTRYPDRYVFFDVPPILSSADALAFVPLVDYIIIVVRAGTTSTNDVKKALELIPQEKVIGFVLNRYNTPTQTYTPHA
jgi:protein-tyrosine kinase